MSLGRARTQSTVPGVRPSVRRSTPPPVFSPSQTLVLRLLCMRTVAEASPRLGSSSVRGACCRGEMRLGLWHTDFWTSDGRRRRAQTRPCSFVPATRNHMASDMWPATFRRKSAPPVNPLVAVSHFAPTPQLENNGTRRRHFISWPRVSLQRPVCHRHFSPCDPVHSRACTLARRSG